MRPRIEPRTAINWRSNFPRVALGRTADARRRTMGGHRSYRISEMGGQITSAALRERILSDLATVWAEDDANLAAGYVATALPAGEFRDRAVTAIVQRWVQRDPMSAAQGFNSSRTLPFATRPWTISFRFGRPKIRLSRRMVEFLARSP